MSHHKPAADALSIIRLKGFLLDDAKAEAAVKSNIPLELRGQNHLLCKVKCKKSKLDDVSTLFRKIKLGYEYSE